MSATRATKPPTRFSALFGEMLARCPDKVAAYGQCITMNLQNIQKDVCAKEFAELKQCSSNTLTSMRARKR